ncbi:MAG: hypothetical protein MI863_11965 [Desulfobacterales bacterium]|nr:hypothetical protein [Desulfobacterales bacterium]
MKRLLIFLLGSILLTGCTTTISNTVHHSIKNTPESKTPKKIIVLPANVVVSELTASGVTEEVPDWSEQGKRFVEKYVDEVVRGRPDVIMAELPEFNPAEQEKIDQHVALYDLVSGNALMLRNQEAWNNIREKEGYTLGDGLSFLCEKTDAELVLIVVGRDFISSGGRKTTTFFAAALGVYIPLGRSLLHAGVVDLKTGNILWMNTSVSETESLNQEEDAKDMVAKVFSEYMEDKQ